MTPVCLELLAEPWFFYTVNVGVTKPSKTRKLYPDHPPQTLPEAFSPSASRAVPSLAVSTRNPLTHRIIACTLLITTIGTYGLRPIYPSRKREHKQGPHHTYYCN